MDLVGFLRDWRRVGKAEVDMEVGAEVVEAKEEDEGGGGEEGEGGEGGQQNWSCGKKFPLLPCLVQVCYCYSGACKGGTLCGPVSLAFFNKGFIRKSAVW